MPPRKRKAPTKASAPISKKARTGDVSQIAESEDALPTRPKRKFVGMVDYKLSRTYIPKKQADIVDGYEAVDEEPAVVPKADSHVPKRRGRPPKALATSPPAEVEEDAPVAPPPKKRGRPATKDAPAKTEAPKKVAAKKVEFKQSADLPTEKRRGRPRKVDAEPASTVKKQPVKSLTAATKKKITAVSAKPAKAQAPKSSTQGTAPPKKRGRPSKVAQTPTITSPAENYIEDGSDTDGLNDGDADEEGSDKQYWLLKAEPNDRFENGVNVKFSIDDLAMAEVPEPWDGVRNFAARNNMRAMRQNDLAFFYHSNCAVPGIVGIMRIVQEHSPDQSAFDPNHPYYDPKSDPNNPKWDCVHVEFVKKFDTMVTLKMLQENKTRGGELKDMQLLRLGRLSVSAVSAKEWKYILSMANEDENVGENGVRGGRADGYDGDTDGEIDGGPREELNGDIASAAEMQAHRGVPLEIALKMDEVAVGYSPGHDEMITTPTYDGGIPMVGVTADVTLDEEDDMDGELLED